MTKLKFFFKKKNQVLKYQTKNKWYKKWPQQIYELTNQKDIKKNKWKKNNDSMC